MPTDISVQLLGKPIAASSALCIPTACMVMPPRIGADFVAWSSGADDRTLGLVDFAIFPHLDYPGFAENTMAHAERTSDGSVGET